MTLIIAVLTSDYAVLASDRRLTWVPPIRNPDDHRNKMVLLCGHFVMGYSGLAELDGHRVHEWVGATLVNAAPSDAFGTLAESASRDFPPTFARIPDRALRRHTFLAVGFSAVASRGAEGLLPVMTAVSNEVGRNLELLAQPQSSFSLHAIGLPEDSPLLVRWTGGPIPQSHMSQFQRDMDEAVAGNGRGAGTVARVLVEQVRRVAHDNPLVGKNILVAVLPKTAVPATEFTVPLGKDEMPLVDLRVDDLTCFYVPAEPDRSDQAIFYGPLSVCPGGMSARAEIWRSKPPWWKD